MKDRELQVECEPSSQDTSLVGKASMWTRGLRLGLGPGPQQGPADLLYTLQS